MSSRSRFTTRFLWACGFALLCFSIPAIYLYAESLSRELVTDRVSQRMQGLLDERQRLVQAELVRARRFFGLVSISPLLKELTASQEMIPSADAGATSTSTREIAEWFLGALDYSPSIEEVLVVTASGEVVLRVGRKDGIARIEETAARPAQAQDDYLLETLKKAASGERLAVGGMVVEYRRFEDRTTAELRSTAPLFRSDGELFGLVIATLSARKALFDPYLDLEPGLSYHVLDAQGDWIAEADPAGPFTWRSGSAVRWEDLYEPASAEASIAASGDVGAYRGRQGAVLVAKRLVHLEGDRSALTLCLVTDARWLAGEVAMLHRRLVTPAYVLLGLVYLTGFFVWFARRRHFNPAEPAPARMRIFEEAPIGILALQADGKVLLCNRVGLAILGAETQEVVGTNLFATAQVENGDAESFDASLLQGLAAGDAADAAELSLSLVGQTRQLRISVARVSTLEEGDVFILGFTDGSVERALRERLTKRNEKLERQYRQRTAELEAANNLAMSSNEIKSDFIANVSHELRTPLHGIAGTLRLLRQDPLNERQQYNLVLAEESVSELTTIVNGIIDVSKLEADRLSIEETDISLLAIVDDLAQRFSPVAENKGLSFIVDDIDLGGELVLGDGDRITRIINIILDNAIRYTDAGSVTARFSSYLCDEEEVLFECSITDTGCGISDQQRARLFQPFPASTPGSASAKSDGIGLGLVIAKQFCNLMFGDLELESISEGGTRCIFRIRLRLVDGQRQAGETSHLLAGADVALILDDDVTASAIKRLFESRGASVEQEAGLHQIDDARWQEINFLVLDLDAYDREAEFIASRTAPDMQVSGLNVLATAIATPAMIEREQKLPENVRVLPLPVTTVGLDAALVATKGSTAFYRDRHFDHLGDASHEAWRVLPNITALVVDDNLVNQHVVGGLFEEYGATVDYAANGKEALDILLRRVGSSFDVILMDCQMPVMDGYEASRRIRAGAAGEEYIDVPIIAVTASALGGDRMKCLDSGMTDYIVKPVKPNTLERLVLQYVHSGEDASATPESGDALAPETGDDEEDLRGTMMTQLQRRQDWNREAFKRRVMGNIEIVQKITELYLQSAPQLIDRIVASVAEEEYRDLRSAAHELSGMSENLGAEKMALVAKEIQLAALDRREDDLQYLLGELRVLYSRFEDSTKG